MERTTEVEESLNNRSNVSGKELEKQGILISKLMVSGVKTGLFGRVMVKVKKEFTVLPPHKLGVGDIVGVFVEDIQNPEYECTVYKVTPDYLVLVGENDFEVPDKKVSVVMLANEATYKRQRDTMEKLRNLNSREVAFDLAEVLLGNSAPRMTVKETQMEFFNNTLNHNQQEAVNFVLDKCGQVGVIHGPPGTGKTTTVVEVIKQAAKRGLRVLATAPSNIAVDNLVEKLQDLKIVRIGHPARMLETTVKYSFDSLLKKTDNFAISQDIRKEINSLAKTRSNHGELNALRKELRERDLKSSQELLSSCQVILATCISSASYPVAKFSAAIGGFDLVIIDEAAQALECACWVPTLMGKKLILAGDHKQLPPTIISKQAAAEGLSISLMERICGLYPYTSYLLEIQYRMNTKIMNWSNHEFYQDRLVAADGVKDRLLEGFPHPLVLIDTAGGGVYESGEISKYNPGEAEIVEKFVSELKACGVSDIAIITPYNAQVEVLRTNFKELEVATVDGFQGREKDVIVISMVRSNRRQEVGFLADFRRLNVAVTRAKKLVCVVMDSDTVDSGKSPAFLKTFVKYFRENALCLNFQEYFTGGIDTKGIRPEEKKKKSGKKNENTEKNEKKQGKTEKKTENVDLVMDVLKKTLYDLKTFLRSDQPSFKTETLDAKDRHELHELCEKQKLYHKTLGNAKQKKRSMLISKTFPQRESKPTNYNYAEQDFESESKSESSEPEETKFTGNTKLKNEPKPVVFDQNEEDEFLAKAIKDASFCMKTGCKKNIELLKVVCQFCNRGFCFNHGLAEAHGCGDRAHEAEMGAPKRQGKILDTKVNELKSRLHDKIQKLNNRKPDNKKNKKKK